MVLGMRLVFAGADDITFAESEDPIQLAAEIERSANESNP